MENKKLLSLSDFVPELRTSNDILEALCERFTLRRKELKLSRQKLADKARVNVGVIRRFEENGYISLSNLIDLAAAMDLAAEFDSIFAHPIIKPLYE